jgi:predicted lipid-binding transport protein (Tim44 family)
LATHNRRHSHHVVPSMASLESLLAFTSLGVAIALLVSALLLLRVLGVRGGQDLALARLAANPARRRLFLSGLYASLAALFALGLITSIETLLGASSVLIDVTQTILFVAGAIGIFILMSDALRRQSLTLQEKWNLQETAERGMMHPDAVRPASAWEVPTDGSRPSQGRP